MSQLLHSHDAARCAEAIVDRVGRDLKLAIPIGVGKPVRLVDALYRLAEADRRLKLTIFTGLTLTRPRYRTSLEERFAAPLLDRLFASYPEPLYAAAMRADRLPPNVEIDEFFLQAGAWRTNGPVQRNYTSLNYSHVGRHLERAGTNVLAQLVAPHPQAGDGRVSLSSNTDVTLDLIPYVDARRRAGRPIALAVETNANLPYMPGEAEIDRAEIDVMLAPEGAPYDLFAPPKEPVSLADYAMALHAAALIEDGGTLQIGIGSFGDALAHALILRHRDNRAFRSLLDRLGTPLPAGAQLAPFETGLYGCTEMLVDGFLALAEAGVLSRRVEQADGRRALVHAGFFVGNQAFYRRLREMPAAELAEICMTSISFTNTLDGDSARKRAQRVRARSVNTAMTATLLGTVSSDALDDGRVVSGVGGQHDLVAMAHALPDARSIIAVRSTRRQNRRTASNIAWTYANATVPRSLRDMIVTEYGIADIKGRSDRDTAAAMLGVADSAFQAELQRRAQAAGKLEPTFALPPHAAANHPARIAAALEPARREGLLPAFPLGSDMTAVEERLVGPLQALKHAGYADLTRIAAAGIAGQPAAAETAALDRLGLSRPASFADHVFSVLIAGAMRRHGDGP